MTREIALHCMKAYSELHSDLCELCPIYGQTGSDHCFEDALQYVIEMLEQEPTTKNDLGVDCIDRANVIDRVITYFDHIKKDNDEWSKGYDAGMEDAISVIKSMPSVTPQEPQSFKWCTDCKEYDTEKHCCYRYSKVIRDTVAEMKQEPRKGHWISHREHCENLAVMPSGLGCYEWCSNCDCGIDVREWHRNHYNFCPNCGAKMVESQESEG